MCNISTKMLFISFFLQKKYFFLCFFNVTFFFRVITKISRINKFLSTSPTWSTKKSAFYLPETNILPLPKDRNLQVCRKYVASFVIGINECVKQLFWPDLKYQPSSSKEKKDLKYGHFSFVRKILIILILNVIRWL